MHLTAVSGRIGFFVAVIAFCASTPCIADAPVIDSISESTSTPSGLLIIFGSDFGTEQNDSNIVIDGINAIATQWMDEEVHAYVPESSSLGDVDVQVVTSEGESNPVSIEVVPRTSDGRIKWYFELDKDMNTQHVALADDGTIYTSDHLGVYAISPDGGLIWFSPESGGGRAISIGDDGTIYTSTGLNVETDAIIRALNPDGSLKWEFVPEEFWWHNINCGPNVGPDGNIYAVQVTVSGKEGLGFFSLDPDGNLLWSDTTSVRLSMLSSFYSEIVFTPDQLYASVVSVGSGSQPVAFAFDLDGNEIWYSGDEPFYFTAYPRVDPQHRAIGFNLPLTLEAIEPDADIAWQTVHPNGRHLHDLPAIDSQGNVYVGASCAEMMAVDPDGNILWALPEQCSHSLSKVGVAPDDSVLVAHLWRPSQNTAITGHDLADGAELWLVELEDIAGSLQHVTSRYPTFTEDSTTAYIMTADATSAADVSRLYAIDITPEGGEMPGDLTGDGAVDSADLLMLLAAWGTAGADLDGNETTDANDRLILLSEWTV